MEELKKDMKAVTKEIKRLAQKTDKIIKQFERFEKAQAAKKSKVKKVKKVIEIGPVLARILRDKICATDIILAHIIGTRDGIDIRTLRKKTGYKYNTIDQIIHSLMKQGKIKSERKEGLRGAAYGLGMSRTLYFEA